MIIFGCSLDCTPMHEMVHRPWAEEAIVKFECILVHVRVHSVLIPWLSAGKERKEGEGRKGREQGSVRGGREREVRRKLHLSQCPPMARW